jgi:hypothetical protein
VRVLLWNSLGLTYESFPEFLFFVTVGDRASYTPSSNPVSQHVEPWTVPYSLATPSPSAHSTAPANLAAGGFGSSHLAGERRGAPQGAVSSEVVIGAPYVPSFSRKSLGVPPRNEQEARAAKEKEVLDELFTSALEELRLELPMHPKRRTTSLKVNIV